MVWWVRGGVVGVWFGNCIVDASIFCNVAAVFCLLFAFVVVFVVVKFCRAFGGCLGTRSR